MPKKRAVKSKVCRSHSCKEKEKLTKCKYCKKLYCQLHIAPLKPGTEEPGGEGHVCPLAYEDVAREAVAGKEDRINVLQKPTVIEADWVIDLKNEDDAEVVRETILAQTESYRGVLVNVSPELDAEEKSRIVKELIEFAGERNWKASFDGSTRLHFKPPEGMDTGRKSLWERFVKWLEG